jgi:hypothetical protein
VEKDSRQKFVASSDAVTPKLDMIRVKEDTGEDRRRRRGFVASRDKVTPKLDVIRVSEDTKGR